MAERSPVNILNCFLENRPGGANLRGYRIALRLRERGIETRFLFNEKQTGILPFPDFEYLLIRHLQPIQAQRQVRGILAFLTFLPWNLVRLIRYIRHRQIDLVHVNGMMNIVPALAAVLSRKRLLWHLNDMSTPRLLVPFLRRLVRRWSWRIAVSAGRIGESYFGDDPGVQSRMVTLYPPIDTEFVRPEAVSAEAIAQFRRQYDLGSGPVVGAMGNLNPAKGYDYFIEAARLIRERQPTALFLIAGTRLDSQTSYADQIEDRIRQCGLCDSFRFVGFQSDPRVVLACCDVIVLSSVREGCPTVVLEAMAMMIPVVAADVGGVREEMIDGQSGFVVPPRDPQRLAHGVLDCLAMPDAERRRLVRSARNRVETNFDIHRIVEIYLDLLRSN